MIHTFWKLAKICFEAFSIVQKHHAALQRYRHISCISNLKFNKFFFVQIKTVRDHRKENRMESFFLAETTKYLYLLFDPDNFLNNDGRGGTVVPVLNGECVIDTGGYIFNTEAHPIDPASLRCCHEFPYNELVADDFEPTNYLGETVELNADDKTPDVHDLDDLPNESVKCPMKYTVVYF